MNTATYWIGVDIGGTKTCVLMEDAEHRDLLMETVASTGDVDALAAEIKRMLSAHGIEQRQIQTMGIGVPARVDAAAGVVIDAPGLNWQGLDLKSSISRHFSFPAYIDNDVRMALYGERVRAKRSQVRDMVFISIGTGLGCAMVANGQVISGAENTAGEIGYFVNDSDMRGGAMNQHGNYGTTEARISGKALSRKAAALNLTAEQLFSGYGSREDADRIVDQFIVDLSLLIANCISFMNPELVLIGGGVSDSLEPFLDRIEATVKILTPIRARISIAELGSKAGVVGACEYGRKCHELHSVKG